MEGQNNNNVPLFKAVASVMYTMKYSTVQVILGLKTIANKCKKITIISSTKINNYQGIKGPTKWYSSNIIIWLFQFLKYLQLLLYLLLNIFISHFIVN